MSFLMALYAWPFATRTSAAQPEGRGVVLKRLAAGLVFLIGVGVSAAAAVGAVVGVDRVLGRVAGSSDPAARLAFGLLAPFGVVLFAVLAESAGKFAGRVAPEGDDQPRP